MADLTEIEMKNAIMVTVPNSPELMTHFVLREQGDWFEDEIEFIRYYIKPGMKVIDIGANYGVYTLTMAKLVGERGKIWAFEPASLTATCLAHSIKSNNLKNVKLIQAGLSNKTGSASLFLSENSELNSLSQSSFNADGEETIQLLTLDSCFNSNKWHDIEFIKLDAEGEENNILRKGKNTLSILSPLIMFELRHGSHINHQLIDQLKKLSYDCYRLIPGLNTLVPYEVNQDIDDYQLNIFACKPDKAEKLISEGLIVKQWNMQQDPPENIIEEYLSTTSYWQTLSHTVVTERENNSEYLRLFRSYLASKNRELPMNVRVGYLMFAMNQVVDLISKGERRFERLCTLARVAFDSGERMIGVKILGTFIEMYHQQPDFSLQTQFLPAYSKYENIAPNGDIKNWLLASVLEQYIIKHAYSCYFSAQHSNATFEQLQATGFMDTNMNNRWKQLSALMD